MSTNGLSVIIPVYNEEGILKNNLLEVSAFLSSRNIEHQLLVIDNGSTDSTPKICREVVGQHPAIKYFRIDRRTVGGAFWLGVSESDFEKITTIDADLSINLEFLVQSYNALDLADIVVGSKVAGTQKRSSVRSFGSKAYIWIAKRIMRLPATDYSIGAKGYRKSKIIKYKGKTSDWTGYVLELMVMAKKDDLSIVEIPITCHDLRASKFNILHEGFYRYWHLLKLLIKSHLIRE